MENPHPRLPEIDEVPAPKFDLMAEQKKNAANLKKVDLKNHYVVVDIDGYPYITTAANNQGLCMRLAKGLIQFSDENDFKSRGYDIVPCDIHIDMKKP